MTSIRIPLVLLCLLLPGVAGGQQPSEDSPPEAPAAEAGPGELETDGQEPSPEVLSSKRPYHPCRVRVERDEPLLDQYRRELFETICEAAAEFDGFFGSQRFDEEARRTHGRGSARLIWDEYDDFELDGSLKVNVDFPNLDHRVNAFLGREEKDDFLSGDENDLAFLPSFFGREGEQEWLIGLGYRPVRGDRSALDVDAGVDVGSKIDPFLRTRYRRYWLVGDGDLVRARQTVYWSDQKGVGYGTRVDFERPLGDRTLARVAGNIVFDDQTEGADWNTGVTLFHGFSPDHAIAWFIGIDGETGRDVPIEDYGTRFTYRQRMLRDWFFGEIITGVTWPKDDPLERRERAYHIGFGFEIQFSGEDLRP